MIIITDSLQEGIESRIIFRDLGQSQLCLLLYHNAGCNPCYDDSDMTESVFFTIFTGVSIYLLGQIIVKLVIDPVHEMKKTIGQISHSMIMYAN